MASPKTKPPKIGPRRGRLVQVGLLTPDVSTTVRNPTEAISRGGGRLIAKTRKPA